MSSRTSSNTSSNVSTPNPVKTPLPNKSVSKAASRRSSTTLQTTRPNVSSNNVTKTTPLISRARPSITTQNSKLNSQRTPSISSRPKIVETQPSVERSTTPSPVSIEDNNVSPLLLTKPLPTEVPDELKSLKTFDDKSKTLHSRSPSTPVGNLNQRPLSNNNYFPVSPSLPLRNAEQMVSKRELDECKSKLKVVEQHREFELIRLHELESQLGEVEQFNIIKPKLQAKIMEMQDELRDLRATNKDLLQQNEKHKEEKIELNEILEISTLDKELAEENYESVNIELENLQERELDLQTEIEMLKNRIVQADYKGTIISVEDNSDLSLQYNQLEKQNERLKIALIRLRDVTTDTENAQKAKIIDLEREVKNLDVMKHEFNDMKMNLNNSENYVEELKQQLDDNLASSDLLDHLTENNLTMSEQIESMRITIEDLEALKELSDELEESHNETEKQMQEHLGELIYFESNESFKANDQSRL